MQKKYGYIIIGTIILLCLFAFIYKDFLGQKKGEDVLYVQSGLAPNSLDPRKISSVYEVDIVQNLFSTLVMLDEDGRVLPCDAERWEVSLDGKGYVFHLRRDAKWSNGEPVTAYDYEYAWQSAMSPEFATSLENEFFYIKKAEAFYKGEASIDEVGVDAIDNVTLSVVLERPTAYFLSLLAQPIFAPVNKKIAIENKNWANEVKTFVSNGPYFLKKWSDNKRLTLEKNVKFWGANRIKLKKIEVLFTENMNEIVELFEKNKLDLAIISTDEKIPEIYKEQFVRFCPEIQVVYYAFNTKKRPFDDARIRHALSMAIDRQKVLEKINKINAKPAFAFVPNGFRDEAKNTDFRMVGGNLIQDGNKEKAKQLLLESGYSKDNPFPQIELVYVESDWRKNLALEIAGEWKKVLGLDVKITALDGKEFVERREKGEFDVLTNIWVGDYLDPMTFIDLFATGNKKNYSFWYNSQYDYYVNLAKNTIDQKIRMNAMHNAEKILLEAMPVMPLYFMQKTFLVKPWVKDLELIPGEIGIDLWYVYLEK